jgi:hypothetical protein
MFKTTPINSSLIHNQSYAGVHQFSTPTLEDQTKKEIHLCLLKGSSKSQLKNLI